MKILAISGSTRQQSTNTALLMAIKAASPNDIAITVFDGIGSLPVFSPDLEGPNLPESVQDFMRLIGWCLAIRSSASRLLSSTRRIVVTTCWSLFAKCCPPLAAFQRRAVLPTSRDEGNARSDPGNFESCGEQVKSGSVSERLYVLLAKSAGLATATIVLRTTVRNVSHPEKFVPKIGASVQLKHYSRCCSHKKMAAISTMTAILNITLRRQAKLPTSTSVPFGNISEQTHEPDPPLPCHSPPWYSG